MPNVKDFNDGLLVRLFVAFAPNFFDESSSLLASRCAEFFANTILLLFSTTSSRRQLDSHYS